MALNGLSGFYKQQQQQNKPPPSKKNTMRKLGWKSCGRKGKNWRKKERGSRFDQNASYVYKIPKPTKRKRRY